MTTFRAAQVTSPGGQLDLVDRTLAEPGPGAVRVAVEAFGICHSDSLFVDGQWPGVQFPVTPGHEIAGHIDALGDSVEGWREGDRVAIGWSGDYCGHCRSCRRGEFVHCQVGMVTGATFPGGYAEYVVAPATALARIPDGLSAVDAAPIACAGLTMFNSLRRTDAGPRDLVAILGIGGLGHLGVQFAVKMGFRTVAIARGPEKADLACELGAHHYIDSSASDVAAELQTSAGRGSSRPPPPTPRPLPPRSVEWERVPRPYCTGNVEGFLLAASKHKWLEVHGREQTSGLPAPAPLTVSCAS
jgi:alcohol dehydrogenase